MKKFINILIPFFLLVGVGSVIIFLYFPELAEALHYDNAQHFFLWHLIVVGLGIGLLFLLYGLKEVKWFNIIGAVVLGISLLLLAVLLFFPELRANASMLKVGYFSVNPMLLFIVGVLWYIDYLYNYEVGRYRWLLWSFVPVIALFWFYAITLYALTAILLGLSVLAVLFFVHKYYKAFFVLLAAFAGFLIFLAFKYPHRITRIQSWIEVLTEERVYVTPSGLDYTVSKLHDGLFIFNEWGAVAFTVVVSLFTWLIIALWKSKDIFTKSIAVLFGFDMLFHLIVFMNWSPIKPPTLFIVEQGASVTLVSFLMMGMVMIRLNKGMRQKL